jgi:hypothetical protein
MSHSVVGSLRNQTQVMHLLRLSLENCTCSLGVVGADKSHMEGRRQESQNEACSNISLGAHHVFPLL